MKKYRRILAGFLAMNLTVSVIPTSSMVVNAGESYEETDEATEANIQTYSEELASETAIDNQESVEESSGVVPDSALIEEESSNIEESQTESVGAEVFGDELSIIDVEEVTEAETEEVTNVINTYAAAAGTLKLDQFAGYNSADGTMTVTSAEQMVLLSYCDPKELQNLNIQFSVSGGLDLTKTKTITEKDIASIFKSTATTATVVAEQQVDTTETLSADGAAENTEQVTTEINQQTAEQESEAADGVTSEDPLPDESVTSGIDTQISAVQAATGVVAGEEYSYQGLGTAEYPFRGTIKGNVNAISVDTSFFGGLSSNAVVELSSASNTITWCGDGTSPIIARVYQFDNSEAEHTLPVKVKKGDTATAMGGLLGTVKEANGITGQVLKIAADIVNYEGASVNATATAGNVGLICNTLESGTICLDGCNFPENATVQAKDTPAAGNAGGVIGEMKKDTKLEIATNSMPINGAKITAKSGNAGGLVGKLANGAQIVFNQPVTFTGLTVTGGTSAGGLAGTMTTASTIQTNAAVTFDTTTVTTAAGSGAAGGLIGSMKSGAQIITGDGADITLNSPNVEIKENGTASATGGAGGVVGKADSVTFETLQSDIVVENSLVGGKQWSNVGGFIGDYTLNGDNVTKELTFPEHIKINNPTVWVNGAGGNSGGYFGILNFNGKIQYSIGTEDEEKDDFSVTYKTNGGVSQRYGAIAGQITSTYKESTLIIQNLNIDSNFTTGSNRPSYHGGLVGQIGNDKTCSYVEIKDVDIRITNSHAGSYFGGITAYLSKQSILRVYNVKIVAAGNDTSLWEGGGILGYANVGSVLELSGITDLTDVGYQGRYQVAQLVRENNNGLIFARGDGNGDGWTYKRSKFEKYSSYINDIGNYGQVIRLKSSEESNVNNGLSYNLVTITDEHDVILLEKDWSRDITLSSADDFALLSIAWNSRGNFSADSKSISTFNWTSLYSKNITLTGDIDLTGTGISCLTRDSSEGELEYTGTFSGNSKDRKLTLSIGETFGYQGENPVTTEGKDGCGKVYAYSNYHNYQGVFAKFKSSSTGKFENIVFDGKIHVSNAGGAITVGGIAAYANGEANSVTTKNVTVKEQIIVDAPNVNVISSIGGFFGECDNNSANIMFTDNTVSSANITIQNTGKGADNRTFAGSVIGRNIKKLICNGLTIQGKITSDAQQYAYVGGLIGNICDYTNADNESRWIEIRNLIYDGLTIYAPNAIKMCGGLFGSIWSRTGVYFTQDPNGDDGSNPKLVVKDATINAPKAKGVGGLAYRASGIWEIRSNGIDIQKMTVNAGNDVGLLICHGEKSTETVEGSSRTFGALYLDTLQYWEQAYKLGNVEISVANSGTFDEFVAYTAASASEITKNEVNGVISLATQEGDTGRVGVDKTDCTTYKNRTAYGKQHNNNNCSRYYYDLDQCMTKAAAAATNDNKQIDTPEELLLWSVHRYACSNIKIYLTRTEKQQGQKVTDVANNNITLIGNASAGQLTFDMEGYSYYPVDLDGNIDVQNAIIIFHNQEIENFETPANNKSTAASDPVSQTQHYTMHCGLFLNHINGNAKTTVNVKDVIFKGTIGKVNDNAGSGVLFAGTIQGKQTESTIYTANIKVGDIVFDNLIVTNCGSNYAPLLMNQISSYTTLEANGIKNKGYKQGTEAASSLIGNVGSAAGKQINLSFLNISLPDNKVENNGNFTHATLLESFKHDGSSSVATYNFYYKDDWNNKTYNHENVTYGREISNSIEYTGQQDWYYDEATHGSEEGYVRKEGAEKLNSTDYLPYVYNKYEGTKYTHEIKVNQRVADIVNGCGTYGHPYAITTEGQMNIIVEYLATATPRKDWRITITNDQSKYHTNTSGDITYQYSGSIWEEATKNDTGDDWTVVKDGQKLDNKVMLQYMLNAYYDIQGASSGAAENTLTLTNFAGFGISSRPFRGVLTSSTKATLYLEGTGTCSGLIPYSYGSVVKDLTIYYRGTGKTLTYDNGTTRTSNYYPDVCFGGVIGCILGGDNIIEDVTVEMDPDWLTLEGDKKHLIPTGGYVGSVCGGGVIFRGTIGTGLTDTMLSGDAVSVNENALKSVYVNPYVGRVLDGFAFSESTPKVENTDKNYQINSLNTTDTACITTTGTTVTVNDSQGLLILSAVVNSGAASGGSSNAYGTTANTANTAKDLSSYLFGGAYGKVRKALYSHIGTGEEDDDVRLANSDDQKIAGGNNLPYLLEKYGDAGCFSISTSSGVQINLKNATYNMADYGSGYQGIAARYVSNAVLNGNAPDAKGIVPVLKEMDGNGSTLILNTLVKEYADDDFHSASVGGVWNLLRLSNKSTGMIQNLTIQGEQNTAGTISGGVSLKYYTNAGVETTDTSTWATFNKSVDVGGIAGATSNISATSSTSQANISFNNIQIQHMDIEGPNNAGGLLGSSGRTVPETKPSNYVVSDIAILLEPTSGKRISAGVSVKNSQYNKIMVDATNAVGGFVGYVDSNDSVDVRSSLSVTRENITTVGRDATLGNEKSVLYAGGAFGYIKTKVYANTAQNETETYQDAVLEGVKVSAKRAAGGFIGRVDGKEYQIQRVTFKGADRLTSWIKIKNYDSNNETGVGGIVGFAKGTGSNNRILNCSFQNAQINEELDASKNERFNRAGGIVGVITNGQVSIEGAIVNEAKIYGTIAGGIAGDAQKQAVFKNCTVMGNTENDQSEILGYDCAGGILGFFNTKEAIALHNCNLQYLKISSKSWGCGGFIGDSDNSNTGTLYLFDSAEKNINIIGSGWQYNQVGGIIGNLRGSIAASNVLISKVRFENGLKRGHLFGLVRSLDGQTISVAGISLQGQDEKIGLYNVDGKADISSKIYISFADYSGSAQNGETVGNGNKKSLLQVPSTPQQQDVAATVTAPYVVTSPVSDFHVSTSNATTQEETLYLYGDGAFWTKNGSTFTVEAQNIFANEAKAVDGHYPYKKTGVESFDFTKALSTYNANQSEKLDSDFPVLQITTGDTETVTQYLNILTNGGFSEANNLNTKSTQHVKANVYVYKKNGNTFNRDSEQESAFRVNTDETNKISFSTTTDYDNDRNRFTLLVVTFAEQDESGNGHEYNLFVPVLVRRMLEVDFSATLSYGTNFRDTDYKTLTSHVLESFGSSISGYLTYTYNSAKGIYTDYGWQSYIDAGGNVAESLDKALWFDQSGTKLPIGTQLSLVDTRNGRVYYYTVKDSDRQVNKIPLKSFVNSDGKKYKAPSIAELVKATAEEDENGVFIKVEADGRPFGTEASADHSYSVPTVQIKNAAGEYEYYRLATGNEKEKYRITVADTGLKDENGKSTIKESYYLVITVPEGSGNAILNGTLKTEISSTEIPHQIYYRTITGDEDGQSNTASTYIISSGYTQKLEEENITDLSKKVSAADSAMKVDVVDTITFPNGQAYLDDENNKDELYLRFVGGLQKTVDKKTSAEQFPSGTTGTANFYVYKESGTSKTYYTYDTITKTWSEGNNMEVAVSYTWTSAGGVMELPLSSDGTNAGAISLQGVRKLVKGGNADGNSVLCVEVRMDAMIPASGLDVIPESKLGDEISANIPDDYTKLVYYSQLSTVKQSLSYSSNRATESTTKTAYYREEPAGAKLSYDADEIDQLGINLLDLAYLDASAEYANIETTATYDLSSMKNLDDVLKNSSGVKFTLSLLPKNTNAGSLEEYGQALSEANQYLSVVLKSAESGTVSYSNGSWSWIVPKETYWQNDNINTKSAFDGNKLTQAIQLKVNVANVEEKNHYYSNYKVVLAVEIQRTNDAGVTSPIDGTQCNDNLIYTLAKIKPEFVDAPAQTTTTN